MRCEPSEACTVPLDDAGRCAGTCLPRGEGLGCERGAVVAGVCRGDSPELAAEQELRGLRITRLESPAEAVAFGEAAVRVRLTNVTGAPLAVPLRARVENGWTVLTSNFEALEGLTLPTEGSFELAAQLRAGEATIFNVSEWTAVELYEPALPGARPWRLSIPVSFAEGEPCGERRFPASFRPGTSNGYEEAVCCGGVFYPGAECCGREDCDGGFCADGVCVASAPRFSGAGSVLLPHQRLLVVVADHPEVPRGAHLCENRYEELREWIGLDRVDAWFSDLLSRRAARDDFAIGWTVLAGLETSDFAAPGERQATDYFAALERHLSKHDCIERLSFDFDRTIVLSPLVEGSAAGQFFGPDKVVVLSAPNAGLTIAHELGHSYGATDLYFDAGGSHQWHRSLMGKMWGAHPDDGVLWAEVGLADLDRDGVVDLALRELSPERLALRAQARYRERSLTLELELLGVTGGRERLLPVVKPLVHLDFPDDQYASTLQELAGGLDPRDIDHARVLAEGVLRVRVRLVHRFTAADLQRRALGLDEVVQAPVVVEQ